MPSKDPEVLRRAAQKWRERHPEKVKAQEERRSLRRLALSPEEQEELRRKKNEYEQMRIARNPEKAQEKRRTYYQEHHDEIREKQKIARDNRTEEEQESTRQYMLEYYRENKEELLEKQRIYKEEHQEEIRERARLHTRQNLITLLAKLRAWKKEHPENVSIQVARRNARKRKLPDTWTIEQQTFMLEYWHNACAICGNQKSLLWTLASDHWIPFNAPNCPGTVATNMIPLCHGNQGCNNSKGYSEPHGWLVHRFGPKKAATIEKAIATYFAIVAERFGLENSSAS